jgi:hypothetical protein
VLERSKATHEHLVREPVEGWLRHVPVYDVGELVKNDKQQLKAEHSDLDSLRCRHVVAFSIGKLNVHRVGKGLGLAQADTRLPELLDERNGDAYKRIALCAESERIGLVRVDVIKVKPVVINMPGNASVLVSQGFVEHLLQRLQQRDRQLHSRGEAIEIGFAAISLAQQIRPILEVPVEQDFRWYRGRSLRHVVRIRSESCPDPSKRVSTDCGCSDEHSMKELGDSPIHGFWLTSRVNL